MYKKIQNPNTGRNVDINSKIGKKILKGYIKFVSGGGKVFSRIREWQTSPLTDNPSLNQELYKRTLETIERNPYDCKDYIRKCTDNLQSCNWHTANNNHFKDTFMHLPLTQEQLEDPVICRKLEELHPNDGGIQERACRDYYTKCKLRRPLRDSVCATRPNLPPLNPQQFIIPKSIPMPDNSFTSDILRKLIFNDRYHEYEALYGPALCIEDGFDINAINEEWLINNPSPFYYWIQEYEPAYDGQNEWFQIAQRYLLLHEDAKIDIPVNNEMTAVGIAYHTVIGYVFDRMVARVPNKRTLNSAEVAETWARLKAQGPFPSLAEIAPLVTG